MSNRPHMGAKQAPAVEEDETLDREFVIRMSARPRPSKVMEWPGDDPLEGYETIRIVIPPERAYSQARLNAHNRMKAETKLAIEEWDTEGNRGIMGDIIAKEMLAACCHRDKPIPGSEERFGAPKFPRLFADSKDVEKALGKQEIGILFDMFLMAEFELGPRLAVLNEEDIDLWIERLKRGIDPLPRLSLPDLVELIRGFHQRLVRLSGLLSQDFQDTSSLDTSGLQDPGSSATGNSFSGEPQKP
jgi:hypothetical protein